MRKSGDKSDSQAHSGPNSGSRQLHGLQEAHVEAEHRAKPTSYETNEVAGVAGRGLDVRVKAGGAGGDTAVVSRAEA